MEKADLHLARILFKKWWTWSLRFSFNPILVQRDAVVFSWNMGLEKQGKDIWNWKFMNWIG